MLQVNPLSANPEKWSNTLKQIDGNLPSSVFDNFMKLVLKGLSNLVLYAAVSKSLTWDPNKINRICLFNDIGA